MPDELFLALLEFRGRGNQDGVIIVRNLPLPSESLGATPPRWDATKPLGAQYQTEMLLIGFTALLGEVFSFQTQQAGKLVQDIVPTKTEEYGQTSSGSEVFLDWHIEDAFSDLRADYVGLLCIRSDGKAATTFASVRRMQIPAEVKAILSQPRFNFEPDGAHPELQHLALARAPVLYGDQNDPFLRFDALFTRPDEGDLDAANALDSLRQFIPAVAREFPLAAGDLLLIDNRRVVHGRTPYAPRYDGSDRWLQRVSLMVDPARASTALQVAPRVFLPCSTGTHERVAAFVDDHVY